MYLTGHSKLNSLLLFRPFIFTFGSTSTLIYLLGVCSWRLGLVARCGAALHGAPAWNTLPGQAALPQPLLLPHCPSISSYLLQHEDTNQSCNSLNAPQNDEGYCTSAFPLSFPRPHTLIANPTLSSVRIYLFLITSKCGTPAEHRFFWLPFLQGHLHCQYIQFGVNKA